jgi:hypothetical protein
VIPAAPPAGDAEVKRNHDRKTRHTITHETMVQHSLQTLTPLTCTSLGC